MAGTYDDRYNKSENATRFIKQKVSDVSPSMESDDDSSTKRKIVLKPALLTSVLAGGFAGVVVDIGLFPLDTIKTRLQSEEGFRASGGFKGIYKGIVPVLLSSAPLSALFFGTYNTVVNTIKTENAKLNPLVYFVAAAAAEVVCATARVPLEVLKQRQQISQKRAFIVLKNTYKNEGFHGFYRGFWSTLMREIPFAAIQYPLWEYMLNEVIIRQNGIPLTPLQTAYCGAAAGGIAAALTTPMDVIKTRIMLAEKEKIELHKEHINYNFAKEIYRDRGIRGFFAGVVPRVLWITLGGFLYFGAYDKARSVYEKDWCNIKQQNKKAEDRDSGYFEEVVKKIPFFTDRMCKVQTKVRALLKREDEPHMEIEHDKLSKEENTLLTHDDAAPKVTKTGSIASENTDT